MRFTNAELKTWYSKMLLAKLVPALRHSPQRSYGRPRWSLPQSIHRWMTETKIYSRMAKKWVVIVGPCDKAPRLPQDKISKPNLDYSCGALTHRLGYGQYPPGMWPKGKVIEQRRFESYVADDYATGGYVPVPVKNAPDTRLGGAMWKYYVDPRER